MEIKASYEDKYCGYQLGSIINALACVVEPLAVGDSLTIEKVLKRSGDLAGMGTVRTAIMTIASAKKIKLATQERREALFVLRLK